MLELTQRPNIESFIKNNLEALEDILDQRAQRYLVVQKEKEKYDFGKNLTPERLRELAREVIQDTWGFLEVVEAPSAYLSMAHLPRDIKYGAKVALGTFIVGTLAELTDGLTLQDLQTAGLIGLALGVGCVVTMQRDHLRSVFDCSRKVIRISEKKEVNAVGGIAHEYTHRLQDSLTNLATQRRNPVVEGHARGVEGEVANTFANRYDNPAYSFEYIDRTAKELKDAYLFICAEKGINPRQSLANLPIPKVRGWLYKFFGHHYSIGVAAMSIAEAQHGDRVYRDVMKNEVSFLRT